MPTKKKSLSWLPSLLKALFAVALIYWLIQSGKLDFRSLGVLFTPIPFTICLLVIGTNLLFGAERWHQLLLSQKLTPTRLQSFKLTFVGIFFNYVVPGGVGGDVVKAYYVVKNNPNERMKSAVTVAMDRLVGLYTMLLMALAVMVWDWRQVTAHEKLSYIFYFLVIVTFSFSVFWTVIFSKRLSSMKWIRSVLKKFPHHEKFTKLFDSFSHYASSKPLIFKTVLISLVAQTLAVIFFIIVGHFLGFGAIPLHTYFFVVPIGFIITAVPIAPAGVGIGQAAFYYLFNMATGTETSLGSVTVTALQIFQFLFGLLGAWFYVTANHRLKAKNLPK